MLLCSIIITVYHLDYLAFKEALGPLRYVLEFSNPTFVIICIICVLDNISEHHLQLPFITCT